MEEVTAFSSHQLTRENLSQTSESQMFPHKIPWGLQIKGDEFPKDESWVLGKPLMLDQVTIISC